MSFLSKHLALEGNIRVLAIQLLVSQIGLGMVMVIWQPYILSQGFSVVELGFVQSVSNLASAAGLFSWGYLSDRYGR
jgi:MFS family permease